MGVNINPPKPVAMGNVFETQNQKNLQIFRFNILYTLQM